MKIKLLITIGFLLIALVLILFYVLDKTNILVREYNDYKNNPDCDFISYPDGSAQLPNCAKYQLINKTFKKVNG